MEVDYQQQGVVGNMTVYGDFPYITKAKQPSEIKETIITTGSTEGRVVYGAASVDTVEE